MSQPYRVIPSNTEQPYRVSESYPPYRGYSLTEYYSN